MTLIQETWSAPDGSPWPSGWVTAGQGAATVQAGRGRLASGTGAFSSHRGRLTSMADSADCNLLISFTPGATAEQYLTVAVRTPSNDAAVANEAASPRGMAVQVYDLLGPGLWLIRFGYDNARQNLVSTTAGLPAAFTAGVTYRLRFLVEGNRLRTRVWAAASPEPSTWALDYTDPDAYPEPGKVTVGYTTGGGGAAQYIDVDDLQVVTLDAVDLSLPVVAPRHVWSMFSRAADYSIDLPLPISSVQGVKRHMGVDTVVATTPFSPDRWTSLQPSRGLELWRDGQQQFTGRVTAREATWDAETGRALIKVEAKGDESRLAKRLSFPDPLRAADDQTVNDYWMSRTGGAATAKVASTAMLQLISDQAGATCRADRQIPGLTLGPDPAVGLSRVWSALFTPVLEQLAIMSASSGANLGLRMTSAAGALTATIVVPRDLTDTVIFSADLSNLVGFTYRETEPDVTHALSAGQGDLHLRLRKLAVTPDPDALAWGEQYWSYIDRRDTADVAVLVQADDDAIANGGPTVSLAVKLTDSQAATYDIDWRLGDAITVYVGLPGQAKVASVSDVCREIAFTVDDKGVERITPAVGTYDAKAVLPTPSQQKIAEVAYGLSGLIARK